MARTFVCFKGLDSGQIGVSHRWTVESSPLPPDIEMLTCPEHDTDQDNEGPVQSEEA